MSARIMIALAVVAVVMSPTWASADPPAPGSADEPPGQQEARELFRQARQRYYQRDYDAATALFEKAYDLSLEPALLFNIAQAQRLAGHCREALSSYRRFVDAAPSSVHHAEAEERIGVLSQTCMPPATMTPTPSATPLPRPALTLELTPPSESPRLVREAAAAPPPDSRSIRSKAAWTTGAAGVALGLAAGGVYIWNNGRYNQWKDEDHRLSTSGLTSDPMMAAARQEANDQLWQSIRHVDRGIVIMAGLSGALIAGATVLAVLSGQSLEAAPAERRQDHNGRASP